MGQNTKNANQFRGNETRKKVKGQNTKSANQFTGNETRKKLDMKNENEKE